jgi:hypothetical protein
MQRPWQVCWQPRWVGATRSRQGDRDDIHFWHQLRKHAGKIFSPIYFLYQIRSDESYFLFLARIILTDFSSNCACKMDMMHAISIVVRTQAWRGQRSTSGSPSDQVSLMPSNKATITYVDWCATNDLNYSDFDRSSRCNIDMPWLLQLLISTRN